MPSRRLQGRRPGVFRQRRPRYLPRDERGRRRGIGGGLIIALLLLVCLGVLLWYFLSQNDDSSSATGTSGVDSTDAGGSARGSSGQIVLGDGTDLLGTSGDSASLTEHEGQTVTATDVSVLAVVADEGFWAGTDDTHRVFVHIDTPGESSVSVDPGDRLTFSGTLEVLPLDFESRFGLTAEDGVDQLRTQGHYVDATQITEAAAA